MLTSWFIYLSVNYARNNKNCFVEYGNICLLEENVFVKRKRKFLKVLKNTIVKNMFERNKIRTTSRLGCTSYSKQFIQVDRITFSTLIL
jgi:hypothetical protein